MNALFHMLIIRLTESLHLPKIMCRYRYDAYRIFTILIRLCARIFKHILKFNREENCQFNNSAVSKVTVQQIRV